MSIPAISIRNPVMITMLCILIIVAGIIGFIKSPLQQHPNITYPAITITTNLPGGNVNIINQTITKPIEKVMNTVTNVKTLNSYSQPGKSSVTVDFELGTNMNAAYNEIENKLNHIRSELPRDARPPLIASASNQGNPVIMYALYGDQDLKQLDAFARKTIEPKLQNVPGVGEIIITGASEQAVSIELNLAKMAAMKISPSLVQQAFHREHVQLPGGTVKSGQKQYSLNLDLEYHKISELKNLIVTYRKKAPIYLKDIATIKFGFASHSGEATYNNHPSIGIDVIRQSTANTVGVINAVNQRIKEKVLPALPQGVTLSTVYSQSGFILKIIHSLEQDIWLAIAAAGLVIFLFLRSFRPTLIIIAVVPISLLGAIATIHAFGFTLNAITLLSLTVLVGIVVDDSIIVMENIFRHEQLDKTLSQEQAAIVGANQVTTSVTACTLALVCIFLPIVFVGGVMSLLFKPFAVVVTAGILFSLLLSLTFNPVLCSRFLKKGAKETHLAKILLRCFKALTNFYTPILRFILNHRWISVLIVIIMFCLCVPAFKYVNKTFMPSNPNTGYFSVQIQAPEGMSMAYTRARVAAAEKVIKQNPNVKGTFSSTGPTANQGKISVQLKPEEKLTVPQEILMKNLRAKLKQIPGALFFVQLPSNSKRITYQIRGSNFDRVVKLAYKFQQEIQKHPELGNTYIILASNQPQYQIFVDRILANSLGITSSSVANTLMLMGSDGVRIGKFSQGRVGERYRVLLKTQKNEFTNADDLSHIYVEGKHNKPIRLNTIVNIERSMLPSKITRTDMQYSVGFSSLSTVSTNKATAIVKSVAAKVLPAGYSLDLTGNTASLGSTVTNVEVIFVLIIGLIYIVLASQFNSFLQPLIVMVMQPLAIVGGLLILIITKQTLNVYSMIGILLLVGLTTKNTILFVSLTNELVRKGTSVFKAAMDIGPARMRPILMTSLALIMAMLPGVFEKGNTYRSLSLVILGGVALSSFLSLVVIPGFYSLLAQIAPPKAKVKVPVTVNNDD